MARVVLLVPGMKIRRHEDLLAWQLGMELAERIAAILPQSAARRDRSYCDELLEAAAAISANIAEGFDRYRLPGFRYFLEIANGSLGETSTRVRQGFAKSYFTEQQLNELLVLCKRTRKLLAPLIASVAAEIDGGGKRRKLESPRHRTKKARHHPPAGLDGVSSKDPTASVREGPDCVSSGRTRLRQLKKDPTPSVP